MKLIRETRVSLDRETGEGIGIKFKSDERITNAGYSRHSSTHNTIYECGKVVIREFMEVDGYSIALELLKVCSILEGRS